MCHTLKQGTRSKLLLVYARDASDGQSGKTGLGPHTPGAGAAFVREGEGQVHRIPLCAGKLGQHVPGSFMEMDAELLPGVYQFGLPDEVLAPGAESAVVVLRFAGAVLEPVVLSLVAYDPQDANRLGLSALGPEGRMAALRGAFPRLTARELQDVR